jgi:hypothetical protein
MSGGARGSGVLPEPGPQYQFAFALHCAMAGAFQGSLLDLVDQAGPARWGTRCRRPHPTAPGWIRPGWLAGPTSCSPGCWGPCRGGAERPHVHRVVDVPRLLCFYGEASRCGPGAGAGQDALSLGLRGHRQPLAHGRASLYRDGRDSVAWHGTPPAGRPGAGWPSCRSRPRARAGGPAAVRPLGRYDLGHGDCW